MRSPRTGQRSEHWLLLAGTSCCLGLALVLAALLAAGSGVSMRGGLSLAALLLLGGGGGLVIAHLVLDERRDPRHIALGGRQRAGIDRLLGRRPSGPRR